MKPIQWTLAGLVFQVGFTFAIPLAIGVLGGVWLDGRLGRAPLFLFLGMAAGIIVGITGVVREVMKMMGTTPSSHQGKGS